MQETIIKIPRLRKSELKSIPSVADFSAYCLMSVIVNPALAGSKEPVSNSEIFSG
jgi:hypothetical protein